MSEPESATQAVDAPPPVVAAFAEWSAPEIPEDEESTPDQIRHAFDRRDAALAGVRALLEWVHEDPTREGLTNTPDRVLRAFAEMTSGYDEVPGEVLGTVFDERCDELIVVREIPFVSLCEHHLMPFSGHATVGYLPTEKVVGLSKLGRIVDTFARRLQVQERMTQQIATAVYEVLGARAAGCVVRGTHHCMSCRGVRKQAQMVTSCLKGELRTDDSLRAEFLALERS